MRQEQFRGDRVSAFRPWGRAFYAANLWIAGLGAWPATLALLAAGLVLSEAIALAIWLSLGVLSTAWVAATTAIVTVTVATPAIYYAQAVIRRLDQSKKELRRAMEHLAVSRQEAESASRMKSQFLANMSHELRTPLNAIIGFSEMLTLGSTEIARREEYAEYILRSGRHLLDLINDILDLSKIEAGTFTFSLEPLDVADLLRRLAGDMEPAARRRNVALRLVAAPELGQIVSSSRLLRQVALNLLSNAIKFSPEGGAVELGAARRDELLEIFVSDRGCGMSAGEIAVALTPFRQVDSELNRRHEGTGLGLPLAKAMTELLGGRLKVRSEKGRGTTVRVLLPAEPAPGREAGASLEQAA